MKKFTSSEAFSLFATLIAGTIAFLILLTTNLPLFFILAVHGFLMAAIVYVGLEGKDFLLWKIFFFLMIIVGIIFSVESATRLKVSGNEVLGVFVMYMIVWAIVSVLVRTFLEKVLLKRPSTALSG